MTTNDEAGLTPAQEAELEESIAAYERGDWIDGDEAMAQLRAERAALRSS